MSDASKQSLAVLRQIADFIETLPPEHVDDLAEGRARLTLIPWGSSEPVIPPAKATTRKPARAAASQVDAAQLAASVESATSRDEVQAILTPLKVADLKAVAVALHIAGAAGTKAAVIKQIVELTAGARLSGDALRAL